MLLKRGGHKQVNYRKASDNLSCTSWEFRVTNYLHLLTGADVVSSLKQLARTRVDLFDTDEEKRRREEEEEVARRKEREKVVWDGHTASKANTLDKFQTNVNFDEQIAAIHKAKGLGQYVLELTSTLYPFYWCHRSQCAGYLPPLIHVIQSRQPQHWSFNWPIYPFFTPATSHLSATEPYHSSLRLCRSRHLCWSTAGDCTHVHVSSSPAHTRCVRPPASSDGLRSAAWYAPVQACSTRCCRFSWATHPTRG